GRLESPRSAVSASFCERSKMRGSQMQRQTVPAGVRAHARTRACGLGCLKHCPLPFEPANICLPMIAYEQLCQAIADWKAGHGPSSAAGHSAGHTEASAAAVDQLAAYADSGDVQYEEAEAYDDAAAAQYADDSAEAVDTNAGYDEGYEQADEQVGDEASEAGDDDDDDAAPEPAAGEDASEEFDLDDEVDESDEESQY